MKDKKYILTMTGLSLEQAKNIAEQDSSLMWSIEKNGDYCAYPGDDQEITIFKYSN